MSEAVPNKAAAVWDRQRAGGATESKKENSEALRTSLGTLQTPERPSLLVKEVFAF